MSPPTPEIPVEAEATRIRTRADLAAFVSVHREGRRIEYKRLRDLRACGHCSVCRPSAPSQEDPPPSVSAPGLPVAEAITALANAMGGVLLIGVRRTAAGGNLHEPEASSCASLEYDADWVRQTVDSRIAPDIRTTTSEVPAEGGQPPAFIVTVPTSYSLHGCRDASNIVHFPIRKEATSPDMDASEIEFLVRTKRSVQGNREFRIELAHSIWMLFDAVLARPAEAGSGRHVFARVLGSDPLGTAEMDPPLRHWLNHPRIEQAVQEMPAKMATWTSPYDIQLAVETVGSAELQLPHEGLDHREARFIAAARIVRETPELRTRLSPFDVIEHLFGAEREELRSEFLSSNYQESYEQVFHRVSHRLNPGALREDTLGSSIRELADVLSLLLPLGHQVLLHYRELVQAYGTDSLGPYGPEFPTPPDSAQ